MAKPIKKLSWLSGYSGPNISEPSAGKKSSGWLPDERPPSQTFNWAWQNISDWIDYVDAMSGNIENLTVVYKAIVGTVASGSPATHASISAALADVNVPNGSKILVLESQIINTPITVSKNFIEMTFGGGVTLNKGAATSGLIVQGLNFRIHGGRFAGFSTAGDKAIQVQAAAKNCMIRDIVFANCITEIDDLASNTSILGSITEE